MKNLLIAVCLLSAVPNAHAQLRVEGLFIGIQRNEALAHIHSLTHGATRVGCDRDEENRFKDHCTSESTGALVMAGHAVEQLRMEFFAKRLSLLEVTFVDMDSESASASLIARMREELGEPTDCDPQYGICEWRRDGQGLVVTASEDKKLMILLMELDFSTDGIFRYENQEFDDLYPVPEAPKAIFPRLLSMP